MNTRRFIPALTTLGVIAGLAAARMAVEAAPLDQTVRVLAKWMHGGRGTTPMDEPSRVKRAQTPEAPPVRWAGQTFRIEVAEVPGETCSQPELAPVGEPSEAPIPEVTNSVSAPTGWSGSGWPGSGWAGA